MDIVTDRGIVMEADRGSMSSAPGTGIIRHFCSQPFSPGTCARRSRGVERPYFETPGTSAWAKRIEIGRTPPNCCISFQPRRGNRWSPRSGIGYIGRMSDDLTIQQGQDDRDRARRQSQERTAPPTEVPGYEPVRHLGAGAFGEVWVAVDENTGRHVAIKFYTHRGGMDWSLLSREVEKLAFLFADRYVVQLIGVGWDADPPYYIMEYLERGSLADRLAEGPLSAAEAVVMFRDVTTGLIHAHGKGVLHCDLKPANILLDQDNKPRLADFGQSRLSHEQLPALGTMFYMAPEQADLAALPEVRWDVYALGAVCYCMLTGLPPHRTGDATQRIEQTESLADRLQQYRQTISETPVPAVHRQISGVDRALGEIVQRCLAPDPEQRFANAQAVLDALDARDAQRARRPMMILGAVGPALLLLVVAWFAWHGFRSAVTQSEEALTRRALESSQFAAEYVARAAGNELHGRYRAVEEVAASPDLTAALLEMVSREEMASQLDELSRADADEAELDPKRTAFRHDDEHRQVMQKAFAAVVNDPALPEATGWFLCDARGVQIARVPERPTIGKNFAWRSYFQPSGADRDPSWRAGPKDMVDRTTLSAVFRSQATNGWMVAVSHPIVDPQNKDEPLGVVALMVEVGRFVEMKGGNGQFAVLVDWRRGDQKGVILQHPLFDAVLSEDNGSGGRGKLPERFQKHQIGPSQLPDTPEKRRCYTDPMGAEDAAFDTDWLAWSEPVIVDGEDVGWQVIVQQPEGRAIGSAIGPLRSKLIVYGLVALGMVSLVVVGLWAFVIRTARTLRKN